MLKEDCGSPVLGVVRCGDQAQVPRLVAFVVVDPVYLQTTLHGVAKAFQRSHVTHKSLLIFDPSFMDKDTATTIIFVLVVTRIVDAGHYPPVAVPEAFVELLVTVEHRVNKALFSPTPLAPVLVPLQRRGWDLDDSSTKATCVEKSNTVSPFPRTTQDGEPTENGTNPRLPVLLAFGYNLFVAVLH
ncbi:MAG: hypothetical protein E6Q97_10450 [Desulfurellales bacterium]|nr:MAG: hypothetical protein E6Q97_10450 [Desulfurellales bacterium]